MKRSEAVSIIANRMYESGVDSEDADLVASSIMKELEDAGMLPPDHYNGVDGAGGCFIPDPLNTWEPEDEKK